MIENNITGRDISREYGGLMEGLITNEEFEEIACVPPNKKLLENI